MADYYELNPFNREASLIISPVDSYTGMRVANEDIEVVIKKHNIKAMRKNDGFYVFVNLPLGVWEIEIASKKYFKEAFVVDMDKPGLVLRKYIVPNRRYKLPKGATFIDGVWGRDIQIYAVPLEQDSAVRLRRLEEHNITVWQSKSCDLSEQLFAFYDDGEMEIFETGERIEKNTYGLKHKPVKEYKIKSPIYPVTIGRTDDDGYLFCPVRGFYEGTKEILVKAQYLDVSFYQRYEIAYGRGNNIARPVGI